MLKQHFQSLCIPYQPKTSHKKLNCRRTRYIISRMQPSNHSHTIKPNPFRRAEHQIKTIGHVLMRRKQTPCSLFRVVICSFSSFCLPNILDFPLCHPFGASSPKKAKNFLISPGRVIAPSLQKWEGEKRENSRTQDKEKRRLFHPQRKPQKKTTP